MANPSSTSSKRLVGLGLRGMRNSVQAPPTQIKSALAQSNPRTSPTVNFAPTGTMTTATTTTPGGLTRTTTTSPSGASMRTSPSMMAITSFTHPNVAQHPGILGGNTTMARTPTSPVGLKTLGGGGGVRGSATTSPTLLSAVTTTTSPFGTPTSTPFVTPNTSPQMLATVGRVGSVVASGVSVVRGVEAGKLLVEGGSIPVGPSTKVELVNASARSMKSPHGEFRHAVDGYFGPMKRLEEIVNEISEEMRDGEREGEGGSPHTEPPLSPELPMFFDVPFPLHPEKTFRIHSSPTTVNELVTKGNSDIHSRFESTTIPKRPHLPSGRVVSNADTITGPSTRSPGGESDQMSSGSNFNASPKDLNTPRSDSFLERFINSSISPSSSSTKSTRQRKLRFSPLPSPSSASFYTPIHPTSSPRSSASSNYSRMSGGGDSIADYGSFSASSPLTTKSRTNFEGQLVSSPPPSPSSTLSRWLREGYEENYSMVCSPSSSPFFGVEGGGGGGRVRARTASVGSSTTSQDGTGVGLTSYSSGGSLSSRKRSGFNSPVAKIETVLGPRERGIGCIPEKRDYHSSLYSKLRSGSMSPGSLTPLEENESMDFSFGDEDEAAASVDSPRLNNPAPSPISSLPPPSLPTSSPISGMPVVTPSLDTVVVANAAVGILSGAGAGTPVVSVAAAAATAPAPRLGLRRKSTGVGSPLVNVVATYDSIKSEQAKVVEGGGKQMEGNKEGEEDDCGDTLMSPILMRAKDSLLLKGVQKQKGRNTMNAATPSIMETPDFGVSVSDSALPVDLGMRRNRVSGELRFGVDGEMKARGLCLRDGGEMRSVSSSVCAFESVCTVDYLAERPWSTRSPTQVPVPVTPTIGPCMMMVEGSKPVDEAISPLQLSSPILPSGACSKES